MRVLIVGDIHGQVQEFCRFLIEMKSHFRIEAAIQLGDFGFYPEIIQLMLEQKLHFCVPVYAVDGNHENHEWLFWAGMNSTRANWHKDHNLIYLPRASIFKLGSTKIGAIGGALNVDRPQVISAKSMTSNFIQQIERERAEKLFNAERPDLIISHTCPTGIGIGMKGSHYFNQTIVQHIVKEGHDPGVEDDCGDRELTHLWNNLDVKPIAWAFGHFHINHECHIAQTHFVCLDSFNADVPQINLWDTEEKSLLTLNLK